MSWVKVLSASELPEGTRQVVKVEGRSVLLLHHEGQIYAVDNICPHMRLPMKKGKITEDNAILCPWHRSAFDLCTGQPKSWSSWPPGMGKVLGMVSKEKALSIFPVRQDEGSIWVDVGAASAS